MAEAAAGHEAEYRRTAPPEREDRRHTPEQLRVMREYEAAVDERLLRAAKLYRLDKNAGHMRVKVADVSPRMADEIQNLTGIDVHGFSVNIDKNGLKHIERRHGVNGEHDHSMADLKDVARMGYVTEHYDTIERLYDQNGDPIFSDGYLDKNSKPSHVIKLSKRIDGTYYLAEAIVDSSWKKIWVQTAYKSRGYASAENAAKSNPQLTSKTPNTSPSATSSIAQSGPEKQAMKNRAAGPADWTAKRVGTDARGRIGITNIVEKMRKRFHVPIIAGHVRGRGVAGMYNQQTVGIRSRLMNDLPTIGHEIGHHIMSANRLDAMLTGEIRGELWNNLDFGLRTMYGNDRAQGVREGFAEFIRKYLQNSDTAKIAYPLTYAMMEDWKTIARF